MSPRETVDGRRAGTSARTAYRSTCWPGGADALLAEITARRDAATTEEERGRLQRALNGLSGLGREVLSDVIANVATGRIG